jgi:glycosyltransferase involved in cell wall biosynthesis
MTLEQQDEVRVGDGALQPVVVDARHGGADRVPRVDERVVVRHEGALVDEPPGQRHRRRLTLVGDVGLDTVLFTNEHQRDFMLERCHDPALAARVEAASVVSPHPTPAARFYGLRPSTHLLDPTRRHIGYFGNFYANRGVAGVLDAFDVLPRPVRDRVQLHVFTSKPDELHDVVVRRGLADCVRVGPFVGYLEFLSLARRMDCLLVNDATSPRGTQNPFLPSKWSDYRGSGTPVCGVVEEGSALDAQPLHHRSPVEHVSAAVQVLMRIASGAARAA